MLPGKSEPRFDLAVPCPFPLGGKTWPLKWQVATETIKKA
jgi:hypothetical protein